MYEMLQLFVVAVGVATLLSFIAVWAPRRLSVRITAFAIAAIFMPLAYAALADLLSKPKPVGLEWAHRNVPEAAVLAASLREGEGIFLWLQLDDVAEPRSYVMPWSRKAAQELQEAQRKAKGNGAGVRMRLPFERSYDPEEPMFYAPPQPAPPPKDVPNEGPLIYKHPGRDA